jgi:hypothetical protein
MRSSLTVIIILVTLSVSVVHAEPLDFLKDLMMKGPAKETSALDNKTTIAGLKQALDIGAKNAVKAVSKVDGYLGNDAIKILLPENVQRMADIAAKMGFQRQVDNLITSMNRAAEAAAPKAAGLFVQAIKEMTIEDARGILQGGQTSATEFFKKKTSRELYDQFRPVISTSMDKVGVAKAYKDMTEPLKMVPFLKGESADLDHYVTGKALDGLFLMIGEEEKKIRTNPAARVTDLLKTVFGR